MGQRLDTSLITASDTTKCSILLLVGQSWGTVIVYPVALKAKEQIPLKKLPVIIHYLVLIPTVYQCIIILPISNL